MDNLPPTTTTARTLSIGLWFLLGTALLVACAKDPDSTPEGTSSSVDHDPGEAVEPAAAPPPTIVDLLPETSSGALGRAAARCDEGDRSSCLEVAVAHRFGRDGVTQDQAFAATVYSRLCDRGALVGCEELAEMILASEVEGTSPDESLTIFRMACDGGRASACVSTVDAMAQLRLGTPEQVQTLLQTGCDAGNHEACVRQIDLVRTDDPAAALAQFLTACEQRNGQACERASDMYALGEGTEVNVRLARDYQHQACTVGFRPACNRRGVGPYNR
ncbi:MAG: sel1 repeat family protein [Myxococcales bacterium]|nr:sel1 repeat family protein [Myxococcales bacterium]